MSAALIEAARDALEAWDSLPRKTYSLSTSVSEWLEYRMAPTIARLRAALAAAERPAPMALLVRDIAADFGVTPLKVIEALRLRGLGDYSVNMAVTAEMAQELRSHFSRAAAEQPAEPAPHAMQQLTAALKADPDYAWSWHCNLAMPVMDATGVTHRAANEAGARLMRHLFDIDITKHPHYSVKAESPAAPTQAPLPHLKAAADAVMAHQWSNSREAMQALTELIDAALAHGIGSKA